MQLVLKHNEIIRRWDHKLMHDNVFSAKQFVNIHNLDHIFEAVGVVSQTSNPSMDLLSVSHTQPNTAWIAFCHDHTCGTENDLCLGWLVLLARHYNAGIGWLGSCNVNR